MSACCSVKVCQKYISLCIVVSAFALLSDRMRWPTFLLISFAQFFLLARSTPLRHLDIRKHRQVSRMWNIWMWVFMSGFPWKREQLKMSFFFADDAYWKKSPAIISYENHGHCYCWEAENEHNCNSRILAGTMLNLKNSLLEYIGMIVARLYFKLNVKLLSSWNSTLMLVIKTNSKHWCLFLGVRERGKEEVEITVIFHITECALKRSQWDQEKPEWREDEPSTATPGPVVMSSCKPALQASL